MDDLSVSCENVRVTPSARSDATRSRARILDAARSCELTSLRLNDVARLAGVGVGTVYRHFPTVHSLVEAVAVDDLEKYRELARDAAAEPDPERALEVLLRRGLALQLQDGGLQTVLLAHEDAAPETAAIKQELMALATRIIDSARDAGGIRSNLTATKVMHLVCGIEHAVRVGGGDPDFYVDVILDGLRTPRADAMSEAASA
jgi:AcrR family transcriptional regulator